MRIWIDLANSPHVPFFNALIPEFINRGHEVEITARDFAETVALAQAAGMRAEVIGRHGGKELAGKAGNLLGRSRELWAWARGRKIDLAVSHNSYSQIVAARALWLKTVTLMDYEYQPANHLAFRLAHRVIVPDAFPDEVFSRYGARRSKIRRYDGIKEDVYLADFEPDPRFRGLLESLGIKRENVLVVVRPPASEALYHRFENQLFEALLKRLSEEPRVQVILLPRNEMQRQGFMNRPNLIIPQSPLDGPNLIAASDLVISAGGTMNREAAALGTPAATIYAGKWAAVDEQLRQSDRLIRLQEFADLANLPLVKKTAFKPARRTTTRKQVAELILDQPRHARTYRFATLLM
jgi:uncharacterized protein